MNNYHNLTDEELLREAFHSNDPLVNELATRLREMTDKYIATCFEMGELIDERES